ncbi:N-acetyltransferase [Streptomyces boninensis]|uniref:N-acetyltransferase n=1 Tax=Streptomyces boninensis TaxID=2039455 RepID=UPI003B218FE6
MDLDVSTLAERPELAPVMWGLDTTWPEFVVQDPVGDSHFGRVPKHFPEFVLVGTNARSGAVVARAFSVPFALDMDGRGSLPGRGWDQVLMWAFRDQRGGVRPDTVSALEIAIAAGAQGRGLSGRMLAAMRDNAARLGFREVVAPVRPSAKHREPRTPMTEYAYRTREDGLPHDPWLRVHARAGATIDSVAPVSMTVSGTLAQWREWTGLPFDKQGEVEVKGALTTVHCEPEHGYAVYVEPNVWMRHAIG